MIFFSTSLLLILLKNFYFSSNVGTSSITKISSFRSRWSWDSSLSSHELSCSSSIYSSAPSVITFSFCLGNIKDYLNFISRVFFVSVYLFALWAAYPSWLMRALIPISNVCFFMTLQFFILIFNSSKLFWTNSLFFWISSILIILKLLNL